MADTNPPRVMVLWIPDWPVVAARESGLLPATAPIALVARGAVTACSAEARDEGVQRGLRVREAQSRCPQLVVQPHDPAVDARAFDPVVATIEERVPGVEVLRPGLAVMRARGAARYYRGEARAAEELVQALGAYDARLGIADGVFAAEQAAYRTGVQQRSLTVPAGASAQFLAPLPIDALDDPALVALLKRLGAHSLGDFAALGAADVLARFGASGELAHARAAGHDPRMVTARTPPRELDRVVEFEPPLDQVDTVAFGYRTAADDFIAGITEAGLVCTAIRVTIAAESGAVTEREWAHPRHFTAAEVVDRIRWQLQGSGGALASPIARVQVSPERVDAISHHEAGLWGHAPDERIHHGLSRIQSMLGHEAVATAVAGGGRMLAERRVLVPWGDAPPAHAVQLAGRPWPGRLPDPPPATVFEQPRPMLVLDASGSTVTVDDRGVVSADPVWLCRESEAGRSRITSWAGPWPVHQRWWDAARRRRAHRFQVVDERGEAWLVLLEHGSWWAEARYD